MIQNYKIITLCGSTRFKEEFMEAQKLLTLKVTSSSVSAFSAIRATMMFGNQA
jgi:hypothetical protein